MLRPRRVSTSSGKRSVSHPRCCSLVDDATVGRWRCLKTRKCSGQVRPRHGTEICNFGAPPPLAALHWILCLFSSIYVQFSKTSPLKSGESSEKSSGENRVKSCHVCGCHGFFRPWHALLWSIIVHVVCVLLPRQGWSRAYWEKPRIRLGCPSGSTFSQAPRKLVLVDFGQKRVRFSWWGVQQHSRKLP